MEESQILRQEVIKKYNKDPVAFGAPNAKGFMYSTRPKFNISIKKIAQGSVKVYYIYNFTDGSGYIFNPYAVSNYFINSNCKKEELEKDIKNEEEQLRLTLSAEAVSIISMATEQRHHPYIKKKKLNPMPVYENCIVIPMYNTIEQFSPVTFQKITSKGEKIYSNLSSPRGLFNILKKSSKPIFYIAEGYATANSLSKVIENAYVVCAFSLSNIEPVIESLKKQEEGPLFYVCMDIPTNKQTLDIYHRLNKKYNVITPKSKSPKINDFNDIEVVLGIEELRNQIYKKIDTDPYYPEILGINSGDLYIRSRLNQMILKISKENDLLYYKSKIAPHSWWKKKFIDFLSSRGFIVKETWDKILEVFNERAYSLPHFDLGRIKGYGIFLIKDKIVFNSLNGTYILENGKVEKYKQGSKDDSIFIHNHKASYNIEKTPHLSYDWFKSLKEALNSLDFIHPQEGSLLLGWCVASTLSGLSEWRPHIWIQGDSSSGKSWIMKNFLTVLMQHASFFQGPTSVAGMRRQIQGVAAPVLHDEAEVNDKRTRDRMMQIIELHRQASTPTEAAISIADKESANKVINFYPCHSACNLSINSALYNDSDKERFAVLKMVRRARKDSKFFSHALPIFKKLGLYKEKSTNFHDIIKEGKEGDFVSQRFLKTCIMKAPQYIENYNALVMKIGADLPYFTEHSIRLYSALIAGFTAVTNQNLNTLYEKEMLPYLRIINRVNRDGGQNDYIQDILTLNISSRLFPIPKSITLAQGLHSKALNLILSQAGIHISLHENQICIYIKKDLKTLQNIMLSNNRTYDYYQVENKIKTHCEVIRTDFYHPLTKIPVDSDFFLNDSKHQIRCKKISALAYKILIDRKELETIKNIHSL